MRLSILRMTLTTPPRPAASSTRQRHRQTRRRWIVTLAKGSLTTSQSFTTSGDAFFIEAPEVPQRAPSHSKKAHVELSRRLSKKRLTPPPIALDGPAILASSTGVFGPPSEADHPFGKELAQVNEVAEEFGITSSLLHDEEQDLINRGLCKFRVEDYISEIAGLYGGVFEDQLGPLAKPWI